MKKVILLFVFFLPYCSFSQSGGIVFNDTVLHNLSIETDLPDWFDVLENDFQANLTDPDNYPEVYHTCNVYFDGIALSNCGFREKGNASNFFTHFGKKKPFKISVDEFTDQTLDGLKKINLNNFTNDPSCMHDVISFKTMRDEGLTAPRTSYTRLWINGEYIGLYLIIENVDKTFLKDQFGGSNNDGNLYKTDRGAHFYMNWLGTESSAYKNEGFKLTTNGSVDDWSTLIHFLDLLNNDHSDDFRQKLEATFDVHAYLKVLAVEECVRSWDSYWGGGNNFFLYEHPDGKIRWIPWDMNETFQDVKLVSGTSLLDGYLIPTKKFDKRPLLNRIFEIDDWKNEYLDDVCDLIQSKFTLDNLGKYILDRHNLIDSAYFEDPYKYNAYSAFQSSLTEDNKDVVSVTTSAYVIRITYPGIYPFIQSQREWAVDQMHGWDHDCSIEDHSIYDLFVYPNPCTNYINISNDSTGFEYAQFRLYNFMGQLYKQTDYQVMEGSYYTMPLDGIPSGIYILTKNSGDGRIGRAKIIIR